MPNEKLPTGGPSLDRRSAIKLLLGATALLSSSAGIATPAWADTEADLAQAQAQYDEAQKQLSQIADDYEALSVRQSDTLGEIETISGQIASLESEIDQRTQQLDVKKGKLSQAVSGQYKDGSHGIVDLILGSESVEELIGNIRSYDKITEANAQLISEVKDERAQLQGDQEDLEAHRSELEAQRATQEEQLAQMRDKQDEAQAVVDGLDQKVKDLIAQRDAELLAAQEEAKKAAEERAAAEEKAKQEAAAAAKAQQDAATSSFSSDVGSSSQAASTSKAASASASSSPTAGDSGSATSSSETVSGSAAAVVAACKSTPSPGGGLCAAWVSNVFVNAGYGFIGGNACDMYNSYATYSSRSSLKPGMIVAVSSHPHTSAGRIYGHIGIYIGGGQLMDNIGYIRTTTIDSWVSYYGATVTPRWGWLGGIVLG